MHVLGGGVTRVGLPSFPSQVNLALALRILVHPTEAEGTHKLDVRLQDADGDLVATMELEFGVGDPGDLAPGEQVSIPIPLPVPPQAALPRPGTYSFELLIDRVHQASVPFIATQVEIPNRPEGGG